MITFTAFLGLPTRTRPEGVEPFTGCRSSAIGGGFLGSILGGSSANLPLPDRSGFWFPGFDPLAFASPASDGRVELPSDLPAGPGNGLSGPLPPPPMVSSPPSPPSPPPSPPPPSP